MTQIRLLKNERNAVDPPTHLSIKRAVEILRQGGLVAFPTETVYGLGARVFDPQAIMKIFNAKGRPADNPLIVHVATRDQATSLASEIPPVAQKLMEAFWPGPLTLVLKRSKQVPPIVSSGLETVAVRSPDHPVAQALIFELGEPIAAPSANRSGRPSPTQARHVAQELGDKVDWIVDGGPCPVGVESTVIDLSGKLPRILRPGAITAEALRKIIGRLVPFTPTSGQSEIRSPGLKHRHYAPDFKIVLVPPQAWSATLKEWRRSRRRLGILCRKGTLPHEGLVYYRRIPGRESDYARGLFATLLEAEAAAVEVLLVETVGKKGFGIAIMDRLERAARVSETDPPLSQNPLGA